jgi:hypothetical protein
LVSLQVHFWFLIGQAWRREGPYSALPDPLTPECTEDARRGPLTLGIVLEAIAARLSFALPYMRASL